MPDTLPLISKITLPNGSGTPTTYEIKDTVARNAIQTLGNPMDFVGVAGSKQDTQPSSGYYAHIEDYYYIVASPSHDMPAQSGDVITINIEGDANNGKEFLYDGTDWIKIGDLSHFNIAPTAVTVTKERTTYQVGTGDDKITITATGTSALASNATFTTTVTPATSKLAVRTVHDGASASGTKTVTPTNITPAKSKSITYVNDASKVTIGGTSGTEFLTGLGTPTTGGFDTDSITGLDGTETKTASLTLNGTSTSGVSVTTSATTKALTTTSIKGVDGTNTVHDTPTLNTKNYVTAGITPTDGTESVSAVSHTSKKLVTTSIRGVAGTDTIQPVSSVGTVATLTGTTSGATFTVPTDASKVTEATSTAMTYGTYDSSTETLTISWYNGNTISGTVSTPTTQGYLFNGGSVPTLGTAKTFATAASGSTIVATGSLAATSVTTNVGSTIVDDVTETAKTVAKAADYSIKVITAGTQTGTSGAVTLGYSLTAGTSKTFATAASSSTTVVTGISSDAPGAGETGVVTDVTNQYLHASTVVPKAASNSTTVLTGTNATGSVYITGLGTPETSKINVAAAGTTTGTYAEVDTAVKVLKTTDTSAYSVVTGITNGNSVTVATGSLASDAAGSSVVTGITSATTSATGAVNAVADITAIAMPALTLTESGTGHTHSVS